MAGNKYVCSECGKESDEPGECSECRVALVATCPVCGNPLVGEHVHPEG
jgi:predicted amidophosphoribosyltransferase